MSATARPMDAALAARLDAAAEQISAALDEVADPADFAVVLLADDTVVCARRPRVAALARNHLGPEIADQIAAGPPDDAGGLWVVVLAVGEVLLVPLTVTHFAPGGTA